MTDSVLIKDKPVSLIPSRQDTSGGDTRYIEEINIVSRPLAFGSWTRSVSSADTPDDLMTYAASLGDPITIDDAPTLVIQPYFNRDDALIRITPIVVVEDGTTPFDILLLETKERRLYDGVPFRTTTNRWAAPYMDWDIKGGSEVYIHVTTLSSPAIAYLYGGLI